MQQDECTIYSDNKKIKYSIPKSNIEIPLIYMNPNQKELNGLLYFKFESAGEIDFKSTDECNISINQTGCQKKMSSTQKQNLLTNEASSKNLTYNKGNKDSVMTPLSLINFHTHPLSCYVGAKTIWGWPSGEDLGQCIRFALNRNLCHIIFAVEGTYVITFNNSLFTILNTMFKNKQITLEKIEQNLIRPIEELFKFTHKHRMTENDEGLTLELDFYNYFFSDDISYETFMNNFINKPGGLLNAWLYVVNNLDLNILESYVKINPYLKKYNILNINFCEPIYNIQLIPNKTIQWDFILNDDRTKKELFNILTQQYKSKEFIINLPNTITFDAYFVDDSCNVRELSKKQSDVDPSYRRMSKNKRGIKQ